MSYIRTQVHYPRSPPFVDTCDMTHSHGWHVFFSARTAGRGKAGGISQLLCVRRCGNTNRVNVHLLRQHASFLPTFVWAHSLYLHGVNVHIDSMCECTLFANARWLYLRMHIDSICIESVCTLTLFVCAHRLYLRMHIASICIEPICTLTLLRMHIICECTLTLFV